MNENCMENINIKAWLEGLIEHQESVDNDIIESGINKAELNVQRLLGYISSADSIIKHLD